MTENDAKSEVKYLKGLFPTLTAEQGTLLGKTFLAYDQRIVRQVIDRHAKTYDGFVKLPQIEEGLRAAVAGRMAQRIQDRSADERTVAQWQNVDRLIDEMTDDDLEELKTHVLTTSPDLNEHGRSMLGPLHPRRSKTIRGLIAKALCVPGNNRMADAVPDLEG